MYPFSLLMELYRILFLIYSSMAFFFSSSISLLNQIE